MDIIIFGASGLIGKALVNHLRSKHAITVVGRNKEKLESIFTDKVKCLTWGDVNSELLAEFDVAINLVGENIGEKRWSSAQMQEIIDSRVDSTFRIASACAELGEKSPRIINASAIGIYGLQQSIREQSAVIYDDESELPAPPTDFLSKVGSHWEAALTPAIDIGVSVVKTRFSVVLSGDGGALRKMYPVFKFGLGSVIGSGKQPFSWVAIDDVVAAIAFLIEEKPDASGSFNIVAEEVVSQKTFAKKLAKVLRRPCFLWLPSIVVRVMFGQMGRELLLNGQAVKGQKLRDLGFKYKFDKLDSALRHVLKV